MLEVLTVEHGSPEWYSFRRTGIGGSDAGAIIGKSHFKTNIDVWEEKMGKKAPDDISDKDVVKYGKAAEEWLIKIFELDYPEYKVEVNKNIVYRRGFMFASLDAELTDKQGRRGILEIKTNEIFSGISLDKWDRQVPENYYAQIIHYLIVTGYDFAILKAQIKGKGANGEIEHITRHYKYFRKDIMSDMKYVYEQEYKFWQSVKAGKRPPRLFPSF